MISNLYGINFLVVEKYFYSALGRIIIYGHKWIFYSHEVGFLHCLVNFLLTETILQNTKVQNHNYLLSKEHI